jgi:hypothetical protein
MGILFSLLVIAGGAILTWGVTDDPSGLNLDAIGVILMVMGIIGFVLALLLWHSWWGAGYWRRTAYVEEGPGRSYGGRWSRRRYVEDEGAPPPPASPPPP